MAITITGDLLAKIAGKKVTPLMKIVAEWITKICPDYEIDTPQEFAHFLAQACHETDHFNTLREYASGKEYEGRKDLGNTQKGDGVRFAGRGIFQTTGRGHYGTLSTARGDEDMFIKNPELLQEPEYAVWSACEFWKNHNFNDAANHRDTDLLKKKYRGKILMVPPIEYISITVNGGYNGMAERKRYYQIAKDVLKTAPFTESRIMPVLVGVFDSFQQNGQENP